MQHSSISLTAPYQSLAQKMAMDSVQHQELQEATPEETIEKCRQIQMDLEWLECTNFKLRDVILIISQAIS